MKFSLEWLASYLPGEMPAVNLLRQRLTSAGFIVEGVEGSGIDTVLDVELTANRPDGMNHRGLAREAAVALGRTFQDPEEGKVPTESPSGRPAAELVQVVIEEPTLCSRFSGRVIEGIRVGPSSAPVLARFARLGLGPISAPVDATNHVLWDIGQPMHAYDLDTLAKGADGRVSIVVRRARAGETLVTLDGQLRTLSPDDLVIADAEKPVGIAGVMGGLDTAITQKTTRILLEAAHFTPGSVRRTSRRCGLHTDASHRFERGTDPAGTAPGLDRAARLIIATSGGQVASGTIDVIERAATKRSVLLRTPRVAQFLGMSVPLPKILEILHALSFETRALDENTFEVLVPTARIDIEAEIDLIEEIIRHIGYDQLPETLPPPFVPTVTDPMLVREEAARDFLAGAGFHEIYSYSFVSAEENGPFESLAPGAPLRVENPLGEPFSMMRATPLVGLLRAARHNGRRGLSDLSLFEVGRSYGKDGTRSVESRRACFVITGERHVHFSEPGRPADFFDGSGAVASLFAALGAAAPKFTPGRASFLSPGRAAQVKTDEGTSAGWVGVLSPALAAAWDLQDPVVADLDLSLIRPLPFPGAVEAPSRFPGSAIDLTVTHPIALPFEELAAAVRSGAPAQLLSVGASVRYQGAGVPSGFVKTTLNLRFGSAERSLSREEINSWRDSAALRLLAIGETKVDGVLSGGDA
ncbi:MAG: phenylalanine--tRNA ligase subunit beta [Thermoanaerobaculia bacterium]